MRPFPLIALALLAALSVLGCQSKPAARTSEAAPAPSASQAVETGEKHAEAGVVPGSYEDWCDEHGVTESACTRCDASLVPAFKAIGDWDEEHGLPKSQCLQCDPNLKIVRPPKPEAN
jgi:hypothetical protein